MIIMVKDNLYRKGAVEVATVALSIAGITKEEVNERR